jgi:hypothetical protein
MSFKKELEDLNIHYRPLDTASPEYYYQEINNFQNIYNHIYKEIYVKESYSNHTLTLLIILISVFLILLITQYLTFADLIGIFSISESGKRNFGSLLISISVLSVYLIINYFFIFSHENINNVIFSQNKYYFLCTDIIIPLLLAIILQKFTFSIFFYAVTIRSKFYPENNNNFFFYNMFRGISNSVFTKNGLAYIYLFRIYSVVICSLLSLLLFYIYNQYSFIFSSEKIITFLVYKDNGGNLNYLNLANRFLLNLIIYQIVTLLYFYSYPNFNKNKQIFDCVFVLYDLKLILSLDVEKTCEKDAFESKFVKDFTNFDTQSYYYYKNKHFDRDNKNLNKKMKFYIKTN